MQEVIEVIVVIAVVVVSPSSTGFIKQTLSGFDSLSLSLCVCVCVSFWSGPYTVYLDRG